MGVVRVVGREKFRVSIKATGIDSRVYVSDIETLTFERSYLINQIVPVTKI